MAFAGDVLGDSFEKTKGLFFPIRPGYWLKMGLVSMLGGSASSGSFSNSYSSPGGGSPGTGDIMGNLTQSISRFNTQALDIISRQKSIIGLVAGTIIILSLIISYINSVFIFIFIDGLMDKGFSIRKSYSRNNGKGLSLFYARLIIGLGTLTGIGLLLYPLIDAFLSNRLHEFDFMTLIPAGILGVILLIAIGILYFIIYEFIVPLMHIKNFTFPIAWTRFMKIAGKRKAEIFIYWLLTIALRIASGFIYLLIVLVSLIIVLAFVLLGIGIYSAARILGPTEALIATGIVAFILVIVYAYAISVATVPIPAFFRIFSLEMVKKLEENYMAPTSEGSRPDIEKKDWQRKK